MIGYQLGACVTVLFIYVTNWPRPLDGTDAALLAVVVIILSLVQIRRIREVQRHVANMRKIVDEWGPTLDV